MDLIPEKHTNKLSNAVIIFVAVIFTIANLVGHDNHIIVFMGILMNLCFVLLFFDGIFLVVLISIAVGLIMGGFATMLIRLGGLFE